MKNLLKDFMAPDKVYILLLGVGDIWHLLNTVAGVCWRSQAAGIPKALRFIINDIDMAILARDIIFLEIISQVDMDKREARCWIIMECLVQFHLANTRSWSPESHTGQSNDYVLQSSGNSIRWSVSIWTQFHKNRRLEDLESLVERRLWQAVGCRHNNEKPHVARQQRHNDCMQQMLELSKCSVQIYKDFCGYDASKRMAYDREILSAISTGNVRFTKSALLKVSSKHVNPTMVRPESNEWNVACESDPSYSYPPLDRQANDIIFPTLVCTQEFETPTKSRVQWIFLVKLKSRFLRLEESSFLPATLLLI